MQSYEIYEETRVPELSHLRLSSALAGVALEFCRQRLPANVCSRKLVAVRFARTSVKMSAAPAPPVLSKRRIQRISLANFETRKDDITKQLMEAATDLGFFMIEDTGISQAEVHSLTCVACVRSFLTQFTAKFAGNNGNNL